MPIRLPQGLPAEHVLRDEGVEVCTVAQTGRPQGRTLRIALLNLMPHKVTTEIQFARLLGVTPFEVELTLFIPDTYNPKTTPGAHVAAFYERWSAVRERAFDGLIVTGAPVETLPFEEVTYWGELTEIFDWARARSSRSFYVCWAAQAALKHFHGVPKHGLDEKVFGIFPHRVAAPHASLLSGFGDSFVVPVSRHTEVRAADLPTGAGLEVLADSPEAGLCLVEDRPRGAVYMFNHFEYDTGTLGQEYRRDLEAGQAILVPHNYYPGDDPARPPMNGWRSHGRLLFRNWVAAIYRSACLDLTDDTAVRSGPPRARAVPSPHEPARFGI